MHIWKNKQANMKIHKIFNEKKTNKQTKNNKKKENKKIIINVCIKV